MKPTDPRLNDGLRNLSSSPPRLRQAAVFTAILLVAWFGIAGASPQTGPGTENRFPPLKVPPGFRAALFACDPLIEYPSAIALGPRPGSLFVAVDYMTGLGTDIVRRDEIRLIEDTDGDGYADKATVYAGGFNSIEGMTFHDGVVYAMHSPFLTALRDTDGDGVADERQDLLSGLGLAPEDNPPRLHCANGIVWGYDGWLYLALGDHGCNARRPEGDRLVLEGGGILRCRPDGRDAHVFSVGLRNIYDVAIDDELNVFVRDNENDGGDYKIRVCHSFFGADHGYPYLYYERPEEALLPLADLGLGSSAGGIAYLETQFPAEYRGNLFFCEWGRAVMRYVPQRSRSGFAPLQEIEFAAGAENDPYGFKPTDLVIERDGSLFIADWADGQRPKRGRGRIYRITGNAVSVHGRSNSVWPPPISLDGEPIDRLLARLDSASYAERVAAHVELERRGRAAWGALSNSLAREPLSGHRRMHAVWLIARVAPDDPDTRAELLRTADTDRDVRVRVQAIRALADLHDPVLSNHSLAAGAGDELLSRQLASLMGKPAPDLHGRPVPRTSREAIEIVLAMGRLRWPDTPNWLAETIRDPDPALAHAAMQSMRHSRNWLGVLRLLDRPDGDCAREIALRALADQAEVEIVDGVLERLGKEPDAKRRRAYVDLLARIHQKPGPWTYWGYRPPPRPANTVEWERTTKIKDAINTALLDPDRSTRLAALRRMQREKIPTIAAALETWLTDERDPECVAAIIESMEQHSAARVREMLLEVVREPAHAVSNRIAALAQLATGLDRATENCLSELTTTLEDGPVLVAVLQEVGKRPDLAVDSLLIQKLDSTNPRIREVAMDVLAERRYLDAGPVVQRLLEDGDVGVRRAAAAAAGKLNVRAAVESLLKLAADTDPAVRRSSLESLRLSREPRVLLRAMAAVRDPETTLAALGCIAEFGSTEHMDLVVETAERNPSTEVLAEALSLLTRWGQSAGLPRETQEAIDQGVAEIQGTSGVLARWTVSGPLPAATAARIAQESGESERFLQRNVDSSSWQIKLPHWKDPSFSVSLDAPEDADPEARWLGLSNVLVAEPTDVQFLASSDGVLRVWLNGRSIYERPQVVPFQPDSDRFDGTFVRGSNRLVVQISAAKRAARFHVRFRRKSSRAEHEQLVQACLTRPGNIDRGRKLFFDAEKSQCIKCHRLGQQGERIGPELTGVGNRFSRIHIIESILEPSRTLAPSYESFTVALKDGHVISGLRVAETETSLTLADSQAAKQVLEKSSIEDLRIQPTSIMPEGLEGRFTVDEFIDLVAFLLSQK